MLEQVVASGGGRKASVRGYRIAGKTGTAQKVDEYGVYYNAERRIWSRGKMTPLEYEEYLANMDEDSFAAYLAKEEETYRKMKEQSTRNAVEKAKKQRTERGE